MEEFSYKIYTEEENRIYYEAMNRIMEGLRSGLSFNESCSAVSIDNGELRQYIEDDALKIVIAEMHFVQGTSLEEIGNTLQLSAEIINKAHEEMMQDIEITSSEIFRLENPDKPIGNA